jgi:hypothetical protein
MENSGPVEKLGAVAKYDGKIAAQDRKFQRSERVSTSGGNSKGKKVDCEKK